MLRLCVCMCAFVCVCQHVCVCLCTSESIACSFVLWGMTVTVRLCVCACSLVCVHPKRVRLCALKCQAVMNISFSGSPVWGWRCSYWGHNQSVVGTGEGHIWSWTQTVLWQSICHCCEVSCDFLTLSHHTHAHLLHHPNFHTCRRHTQTHTLPHTHAHTHTHTCTRTQTHTCTHTISTWFNN